MIATWIHLYPHDFTVQGTSGALSTLIKCIIQKSLLLQYALDFRQFLVALPTFVDNDATWSVRFDGNLTENGQSDGIEMMDPASSIQTVNSALASQADAPLNEILKNTCAILTIFAHNVNAVDTTELAEEITRAGAKLFLDIEVGGSCSLHMPLIDLYKKPRHWLRFVVARKPPQECTISRLNAMANHLAGWCVTTK